MLVVLFIWFARLICQEYSLLPPQAMDHETVYRFEVWNLKTRTKSFAPQMGTQQAIRRLRGEADLGSAQTVARCDIDSEGFYRKHLTSENSEKR